ncbi:MAG: TolC family protein [Kofleriaceae bacterium]
MSKRTLVVASLAAVGLASGVARAQPEPAPPAPAGAPLPAPDLDASRAAATFDAHIAEMVNRPGGLTADAAAERAAKVSPDVRRKAAEVAKAYADAKRTELVRVPRFSTSLTYTRLSDIDPPELAPGFTFPVLLNSTAFTAELGVPLSDYLLTFPALLKAAQAGTVAARTAERASEVDARHQARLAYYEWVRSSLQVLVGKQLVEQVEAALVRVTALSEVRAVTRADLLRVQAQRAQVKLGLAQLESAADLREQQLRLLIGAEPGEVLTIGEDVQAELPALAAPEVPALLAEATQRRLDVKTLDAGILARQQQARAQRAGKYPRLAAFAQATYANPNQRIQPSHDEFDFTWAAGVSLSWSLNDMLDADAAVASVDAEARTLVEDRARLLQGVQLELESAASALELARASLEVSQEGLAAAEEGYRLRQELLSLQRATAVEIVDAETELTRARIAAVDARIDERVARLRLRHATGEDI